MFHSFEPLDIISSHTFDSGTMFWLVDHSSLAP
jgi:hypothetical protein